MTAREIAMSPEQLMPVLDHLLTACKAFNLSEIQSIFRTLPLEYSPLDEKLSDLVWEALQESALTERPIRPVAALHQ